FRPLTCETRRPLRLHRSTPGRRDPANHRPSERGSPDETTQDIDFPITVGCAATTDPTVGSTCAVSSTADAAVPGSVTAGNRTIWQLGQVQVFDGGSSGTAEASDATVFEVQWLLAP